MDDYTYTQISFVGGDKVYLQDDVDTVSDMVLGVASDRVRVLLGGNRPAWIVPRNVAAIVGMTEDEVALIEDLRNQAGELGRRMTGDDDR